MTQQIIRAQTVDAPTPEKLRGSILDAATIHEGMAWIGDQDDPFPAYNCLSLRTLPGFCYVGGTVGVPDGEKDFDVVPWSSAAKPFGVYGGLQCKPVGSDLSPARVRDAFLAREGTAVEMGLMEGLLSSAEVVSLPAGVTADVRQGIAWLEGHAACHYAGVPTLHLPRGAASILAAGGGVESDGNMLRTRLGSKIAAGGGYDCLNQAPDGTNSPSGKAWLYVSGEVVLWRSDLGVHDAFDTTNNDQFVLAERIYMAAVDCYMAAVQIDLK